MSGDWSMLDRDWSRCLAEAGYAAGYEPQYPTCDPRYPGCVQRYPTMPPPAAPPLGHAPHHAVPGPSQPSVSALPRGDNPREIRNKAEKQRRDKLNQSIAELASMVPPVMAASRRIDKTGVLRLTAHYLRAHQYVFGDSINQQCEPEINTSTALSLLHLMKGFLITVTYKGLVVVVSQNVTQYLGYTELDLVGQSIMNITHEDDRKTLKDNLMPETVMLGPNGELLFPDDPDGKQKVREALAKEKRRFVVRLKKLTQRSEQPHYVTCYVEGSLRKADRACRGYTRCCQMVRRVRARGDNPCSSGNDIVFIGVVRPSMETFIKEKAIEAFRMDYRTRHSVDGEIIQCEQKISLVTGYMIHEVYGLNAMNFMHRDDVRWVIIVLRNMYDQNRLMGESCYRLMTKNGNFIYMRTRGCLEVDKGSRAVTTFVCTNSVVDENEGKHLIAMMKKKFMVLVNNNKDLLAPPVENPIEPIDGKPAQESIEDPRCLEKVILHLVTNLPSPEPGLDCPPSFSPNDKNTKMRLAIIPPRKERIVSTIEKIYTVIKSFDRNNARAKITEITDFPNGSGEKKESESDMHSSLSENGDHAKLEPFEQTFLKRNVCDRNDQVVSKISDHVLAAVQLNDRDASTSVGGPVKRPSDQYDDDMLLSYKRKTRDMTPYVPYGDHEPKIINEVYDSTCLDSFLDDTGLDQLDAFGLIQAIDNSSEENHDPYTDILLESDFEELFASVDTSQLDAAGSKDSP